MPTPASLFIDSAPAQGALDWSAPQWASEPVGSDESWSPCEVPWQWAFDGEALPLTASKLFTLSAPFFSQKGTGSCSREQLWT